MWAQTLRLFLVSALLFHGAASDVTVLNDDARPFANMSIRKEFSCYRNVEGTYAAMRYLEQQASGNLQVTVKTFGATWHSRPIYALEITGNSVAAAGRTTDKGIVFITTGLHAREYAPPELVLRWAEDLVERYKAGHADTVSLLDHTSLHLVIQSNPDGRLIAESERRPNWRKNNHTNATLEAQSKLTGVNGACLGFSGVTGGVDLNRNFRFRWGEGGASKDACDATFRGYESGPEPEILNLMEYAKSVFPAVQQRPDPEAQFNVPYNPNLTKGVYIDIHSYGDIILWPWIFEHLTTPQESTFKTMARRMALYNAYGLAGPEQVPDFGPVSGGSFDWFYGALGAASFAFETGTKFYVACTDFVKNNFLKHNHEAFTYAAKVSQRPYLMSKGPTVEQIRTGASTSVWIQGDLEVTVTAVDFKAATVETIFLTIDMHPQDVDSNGNGPGEILTISQVTNTNPGSTTQGLGTLSDTSVASLGLALGGHTLYAYAQNNKGHVGPVTATSFTVTDEQPPACIGQGAACDKRNSRCCDPFVCVPKGNRGTTECARCKNKDKKCSTNAECCGFLRCQRDKSLGMMKTSKKRCQ